jgi:hypothetical protein
MYNELHLHNYIIEKKDEFIFPEKFIGVNKDHRSFFGKREYITI